MEGTTLAKLQVIIDAYTKPIQDKLKKVEEDVKKTTGNITKHSSKIGGAFKKIAKIIAISLSTVALVNFSKSCIELGSNLSEVQNVVDVTFGDMASKVNDFAKTTITQFGLSETSAKKYTSTMGAMLKSMGFATESAYGMSTQLTGLSADMASFYNLDAEESFSKIRSGISGETEPLKQLGINMSVANLEAYALSQGLNVSYNSMSQMEQATLRYNYLLSVTKDAQGDFARTSDSWANQTRILSENFNALKASIGQGLITAFTPVIKVLNTLMAKLQKVAAYFSAFMKALFGGDTQSTASVISDAASGADNMASSMDDTADAAKKVNKQLAGFDELNNKTSGSADSSASGTGAGGVALDMSAMDMGTMSTDDMIDTTGVEAAAQRIKDAFESIRKTISDNKDKILMLAGGLGAGIAAYLGYSKWPVISQAATELGTIVSGAFSAISWPAIAVASVIALIVAGIIDLWNTSAEFRDNIIAAWDLIVNAVKLAWSMIWEQGLKPLWDSLVNLGKTLGEFYNKYLKGLFEKIIESIAWIVSIITTVLAVTIGTILSIALGAVSLVVDGISWLIGFIGSLIDGILWLLDNWDVVFNSIGEIASNIFDGIVSIWSGLCDWFSRYVIDPIAGAFGWLWDTVSGAASSAWNGILNLFSEGGKIFLGVVDGVAGVFKTIVNALISGINKVIAIPFNTINGLLNGIRGINILGVEPFSGLWGRDPLPVPQIPKFAKGGVVNKATIGMFGEAGAEAIVPLEKNTGWIQNVAVKMASLINFKELIDAIYELMDTSGNITVVAELDGEIVYKKIVKRDKETKKMTGKSAFA